ncbi:TetR/AcrR family transcriptional regulator [Novosphingobium acidiphilum]|jgi:TetR/AcrR family transcriptional repressor of nem operon|uniref:TetR/AcrR family transcriptional regulator n=1 Tax=Novosphingobium acidiphilum TaxID=505248 RepID=UPI0004296E70|nr:TetR/AcrR family transcriptional regulator [Novosphingobium acidiphilum]
MARPRSFDIDAFLDRSLDVFWRRGFAATSMSDIYEATGLGASSIYAFVKDKNDLFRRVFQRYGEGFRSTIPTGVEGAAAIDGWLRGFVGALADDPDRKGCLICNTIMERFAHSSETLELAQMLVDEVRGWFQLQIENAQRAGDYRRDQDPATAANALVVMVLGLMAMARAQASRETLLQVAGGATVALARGPRD